MSFDRKQELGRLTANQPPFDAVYNALQFLKQLKEQEKTDADKTE